jgi:cell division protein FtsL
MKKAVFIVFTVFLLIFPQILQGNSELTAAGGETYVTSVDIVVEILFIILFLLAIVFSVQYLRNKQKNYTMPATLKPTNPKILDKTETEINENKKEKEKNAWKTKPQEQWNQTDHQNYRIYLEKELLERFKKCREEEIDSKLEELPDIVSTAFKNMTDSQKIFFFCTTATILMLLAAILWKWPYGCYRLLKIAVTGVSIRYICCQLHPVIKFIFIAVAILYNPILPIELDERETWQIINALTIPLLGYSEVIIMMKVSKLWPSEK